MKEVLLKLDKKFGVSLRVRKDDKHLRVLQVVGGRVELVGSWWGLWRQNAQTRTAERRFTHQHTGVVHLLDTIRVRLTVCAALRVARVQSEIDAISVSGSCKRNTNNPHVVLVVTTNTYSYI